jgi:hypothetical protein
MDYMPKSHPRNCVEASICKIPAANDCDRMQKCKKRAMMEAIPQLLSKI